MSLTCLPRILKYEIKRYGFILASIPKISVVPSATITSKEFRDPTVKKPAPWPYKTKKFTYFHAFWQSTMNRFDENTKIIVVDGNIAAGKTEFAKQLAEAFDFHYIPESTIELTYKTPYGYDLRQLNPIVPPSFKICDLETYLRNPHHPNVAKFQFNTFFCRLHDYIDGLAHLLNTGQGIVMERSVYSDFVFLEAMFKAGYLRKEVKEFYYLVSSLVLDELLRPHLIVYLDVSPEVALERIKKRNNHGEATSPVMTKDYLESIEYFYKQVYLKEFQKHSELLIYDWNNYGDVEVVVEDIERIDFDRFSQYDTELKDWRKQDDWTWAHYRRYYTNDKHRILTLAYVNNFNVHELYHPREECNEYNKILDKIPGERYAEGFNPSAGENVFFKNDHISYWYRGLNRYVP